MPQNQSDAEAAREYTRQRLSGVNYAFGDIVSGNVRTGKYSDVGATRYYRDVGYTRTFIDRDKKKMEERIIAEDNQFISPPPQPKQTIVRQQQSAQGRIEDIEAQLASGLVRAESRQALQDELSALRGAKQQVVRQSSAQKGFEYGDSLSKLQPAQQTKRTDSTFKYGQSLSSLQPVEDKGFLQKVGAFAKKAYEYDAVAEAAKEGRVLTASTPSFLTIATPAGVGKVGAAWRAIRSNPFGRFFQNAGVIAAETAAIQETAKQAGASTAPKDQKEVVMKLQQIGINPNIIYGSALSAEEDSVLQRNTKINVAGKNTVPAALDLGFVTLSSRGLIRDLPGGTKLVQDKKTFEAEIKRQGQAAGLSKQEVDSLVAWANRQKNFRAGGEVAGALNIERGAEKLGRDLLRDYFLKNTGKKVGAKQVTKTLFANVGARTAVAGSFEGAAGEFFQRQSRAQDQNLNAILGAGAVGTVFAGTAGGALAARTAKGKGRVIETFLNIVDPLEKPGDIIQDTIERTQEKIFKKSILQPSFTKNQMGDIMLGTTVRTPSISQNFIRRIGKPSNQAASVTKTKTPTTFSDLINEYEKSVKKITDNGKTNFPTTTRTKDDVPTVPKGGNGKTSDPYTVINDVMNDYTQRANENTNAFVNSFMFTQTPTKVPTTIPFPRILPPVPPVLPTGFGGIGAMVGKRTKFVNEGELAAAFLFGNNRQAMQILSHKKTNKSKRKKR